MSSTNTGGGHQAAHARGGPMEARVRVYEVFATVLIAHHGDV
jgi:hypothetical protein